jgi:hypothetical protein
MKLIPLRDIPSSRARETEAIARRKHSTRKEALQAARWRLVSSPGCHSHPYWDPPCEGLVLTQEAAKAIESKYTHMPGGTVHQELVAERE